MSQDSSSPPAHHTAAVTAVAAGLATALYGLLPLRQWDTWWHIAVGDVIARFDAVPMANRFTFGVAADTPSVLHEWLAQFATSHLHAIYGMEGVLTARNLLFFLAVMIVGLAPRGLAPRARATGVLCAGLLVGASMFATPPMFAAPLFALCVVAVWRTRDTTDKRVILGAMCMPPLCTLLWANMDIAYGLPALLAAYAAGVAASSKDDDNKKVRLIGWSVSALACLLVPLINPRGTALVPHTLEVLFLYPMHEHAPLWSHLFTLEHLPRLAMVLAAVCAIAYGWRGKPRAHILPDALLLAALVFFAVTHMRAMMWLGLCLPVLLAGGVLSHEKFEGASEAASKKKSALFFLLAASLALSTQPIFLWRAPLVAPLSGVLELRTVQPHQYSISDEVPVEAGELLAQQQVAPRVWASRKYEGYVLYKLLPKGVKPITFTDQRLELFSEDVTELRELMRQDRDLWRGLFQGFDVGAALLDGREDAALVESLKEHADWQLVHTRGDAHYFVRVLRAPATP